MKTVHEVSDFTGVSVRTLHYYDEIGLLKPAHVTEAGYRLYGEDELRRLSLILLFRELRFPLKEIKSILDDPDFDEKEALRAQIALLTMEKERTERLLALADDYLMKGTIQMDFTAFDRRKEEAYAAEAKKRWGKTEAYKESMKRSPEDNGKAGEELMSIFEKFGKIKDTAPGSDDAQALVAELQNHITANFYTCTDEILQGLGEMYVGDERFRESIDKRAGDGTAEFVSKAIKAKK